MGGLLSKGVDMNTEGNSDRIQCLGIHDGNQQLDEGDTVTSASIGRVRREPYPVSWQPAK